MKKVIYRITDYHSNLKFIDCKGENSSSIEAFGENGARIRDENNALYRNKAEIIISLINQNKNTLCAFGSSRSGGVSQNKPFIKDGVYNDDLFKLMGSSKVIKGIKGLCGIIRGTVRDPEDPKEKIDVTLEIRSRFDKLGKPWFLYTMITEAVEDADVGADIGSAGFSDHIEVDIMSLLTVLMFSIRLKKACENGIYRTYVRREYNDDRLRGSIDIARHLRLNINSGSANIAYSTRERNEDNMLNRLIAHAWNALRRDYPNAAAFITDNDPVFRQHIGEIISVTRGSLKDVRDCIAANSQPITSLFYSDHEELRELCLQILAEEAGSEYYASGGGDSCMSILFYIPDLWEKYLEKHIKRSLPADAVMHAQDGLDTYSAAGADGGFGQQIFPDYVFYHGEKPFFVLDAKYKKYQKQTVKNSLTGRKVSENIPWQLKPARDHSDESETADDYNKLLRDMVSFGAHNAAVVFPYACPAEALPALSVESLVHRISKYNNTDRFWHFPVFIPNIAGDNNSYSDWKKYMSQSIGETVGAIISALSYGGE